MDKADLKALRLLPNLLSLLRIALVPVFVHEVLAGRPRSALIVFFVAGTTDVLDGWAARSLNIKSKMGLWLDPAADKILLTSAFVILTLPAGSGPNILPLWLTISVIGRDVLLVAGSLIIILLRGEKQFFPSLLGKASTVSQVATVSVVLLFNAIGNVPWGISQLYTLTMGLTLVSAVHYFLIGIAMLRGPRS